MALRPEYSLGNSELNEFLFAIVGEERSGQQLTVLSALARLGLDPWGEAARLSELPRDAATRALLKTIGAFPGGDWKESDCQSIAVRLVNCLPKRGAPSPKLPQGGSIGNPNWLVWIALGVAVLVVILRMNAD